MQLALRRTPATEYLPSLSKISPHLVGKMGLMLTNRSPREVYEYFNQLEMEDYARAGNRVLETVVIDEGPLDGFEHTMEPLLRSLGDVLTPEQAKLFKLFQRPLAQFKIKVKLHWDKDSEQVQAFDLHDEDDQQQHTEDNDEEMIE